MNELIRNARDDDFESLVLACDRPVLVDFWAEWCGPCKAIAGTLDELSRDYAGEVDFVKVDVEKNTVLAQRFNARSIPLLVLFKGGVEVARAVGATSKTRLAAFIDANC